MIDKDGKNKSEPDHHVRHVFDGIEEEDNDLPTWWLNLFYVCIVFGFGYMAWFHWPLGKGESPEQEFAAEMAVLNERVASAKAAGFDYRALVEDKQVLASGAETYASMCLPCHGDKGQGGVGPNLTDGFWIVPPTLADVEHIIANGKLDMGMPAWEPVVGPDKVKHLVIYVRSLQGTTVENGKEPQGTPGKLP
jgi:cytochrome c oxidase cbb3-type subunit 3